MSADVVSTVYLANTPANYLNDCYTMCKKTSIDGAVVWEKVHNACKCTFSHQYLDASLDAKHAMKCRLATHSRREARHPQGVQVQVRPRCVGRVLGQATARQSRRFQLV